jgi:hypothetical protein
VIKKDAKNNLKYGGLTKERLHMWNAKTKVMPIITGAQEPSQNHPENIWTTYQKSTISRNCRKQPYLALTSESTDVKVQNVCHVKYHYVCH